MPSGDTHRNINVHITLILLIGAIATTYFLSYPDPNPFYFLGILFSTYYMNSDNDTQGTRSDKMSILWDLYWNKYSQWFKHRGVSHSITLGTLSRLGYILPLLAVFIFVLPLVIRIKLTEITVFINKYPFILFIYIALFIVLKYLSSYKVTFFKALLELHYLISTYLFLLICYKNYSNRYFYLENNLFILKSVTVGVFIGDWLHLLADHLKSIWYGRNSKIKLFW